MLHSSKLTSGLLLSYALLAGCMPEVRPFTCDTDAECGVGLRCVTEIQTCAQPSDACEGGWQLVDLSGAGTCVTFPPPPPPPPPPFVRDVCLVGPAMPPDRDTCVDLVCDEDPRCCELGWNETCVQAAARSCDGPQDTGRCPADVTLHGFGGIDTLRPRPAPATPGTLACIDAYPNAAGSTLNWTTQAAWADADADGDADLAVVAKGGLRIFESNGVTPGGVLDLGGALVQETVPWGAADASEVWGSRVAWGDTDHDGDLDLAWFDAVGGLRVYVRDPAAPTRYRATTLVAREEMSAGVIGVGVGWMQLDQDPDLELTATLGTSFVLFDRKPDGTWTRTTSVAAPSQGGFVSTFDRLAMADGLVYFAGTMSLTGGSFIGTTGRGVAVGDIDGNGRLDVVIGNWEGVYLHSGGETGFAAPQKISVLTNADIYGVGIGDLDGNGSLDIYGGSHQNAESVMIQRADGGFDTPTMPTIDHPGVSIVSLGKVRPFDTGRCNQ
ncbi:MAG TPA: VCBS repeat-containing protein [Kofleriaceae bacterium]|nr:VCBS repeat-containing protein [Kofleriaceae bacterium]